MHIFSLNETIRKVQRWNFLKCQSKVHPTLQLVSLCPYSNQENTANKITPAFTAFALSNNRPTASANYRYLMLCLLSYNADCVQLYRHQAEMIDYNAHCDYCIANGFGKKSGKNCTK